MHNNKLSRFLFVTILVTIVFFSNYNMIAQEVEATVHYLGNEGIMVKSKQSKMLFDPFFHKNFQIFTLVPEKIRAKIFNNDTPFENVEMIFISHTHADHFDAKDIITYLNKFEKVILVAPTQVINKLKPFAGYQAITDRLHGIDMKVGDPPIELTIKGIEIEAIRIPHLGGVERADIENVVYRVTTQDGVTVAHLGDSDIQSKHYLPYSKYWKNKVIDHAFIPDVFALTVGSEKMLRNVLNINAITLFHVPTQVPPMLKELGIDFFAIPGETRKIIISQKMK